jgi:predicted transcriptional regulator of viral defense system
VKGLKAASAAELKGIASDWDLEQVEIIAPPEEQQVKKSYRTDLESVIMETISRRPCTLRDLEKILGMQKNEINKYLVSLEKTGSIETVEQDRGTFYQIRTLI